MGNCRRLLIPLALLITLGSAASTVADPVDEDQLPQTDDPQKAFLFSISMIIVSEIGDKTFLIAALMAMRHPRMLVFSASAASLFIMTILSGIVGRTFTSLVPQRYTQFAAGILFLVFGYKLTLEGLAMSKDVGVEEELAEVEEEIAVRDMNSHLENAETGQQRAIETPKSKIKQILDQVLSKSGEVASYVLSPTWVQIFTMVFLGEFGDRSQISTIAMASGSDYWSVIFGAIVGHAICTGMAVVGGKFLASKISMRTVTLGGAFSFFIFAIMYIYEAFNNPN